MKIAFLILEASLGGHIRSAISIAKALKKAGEEVYIILPDNYRSTLALIEPDLEFSKTVFWVKKGNIVLGTIGIISVICKFIAERNIDVIHSFDLQSHIVGYFVYRVNKVFLVSTICGGTIKYRYPFTIPVIVFSKELKDTMTNKLGFKPKDIIVESGRIDVDSYINSTEDYIFDMIPQEDILKKKILMVSRLSVMKEKSILYALEVIEMLSDRRQDFIFIIVGAVQDDYVRANVAKRIAIINIKNHCKIVFLENKLRSHKAFLFLKKADIVMGVGRVCFEGMVFMKPTLIMGEGGFAGLISPTTSEDDLEKIAYYNFSGRNVINCDPENRLRELSLVLDHLLTDKEMSVQCGKFGRKILDNYYHVRNASRTYSRLYQSLIKNETQKHVSVFNAVFVYFILIGGKIKDFFRTLREKKNCQ